MSNDPPSPLDTDWANPMESTPGTPCRTPGADASGLANFPGADAPGLANGLGADAPGLANFPGADAPGPGRWCKYLHIMRIALSERLVYRADFFLSTILRFLPVLTTILLWHAVYAGTGAADAAIGGFRLNEMIAYLLLVHISRMFSSMPGLAHGIARDIRDGGLKKYLLQPIHLLAYLLAYRVAHKAAYITMSALPYALLFWLCRGYFAGWPDVLTLLAYAASLLLAFLIGFFMEASFGMLGFWFLEVSSFLYVVGTLTFFISGQMIPLDVLPPFWASLLKALPLQYLAYFPATVFLGKIEGWELVWGLLVESAWAGLFIALACWTWQLGLKRYSAYGG